ncbi:MAG TPA: hypothetical protein VNA13_01630 [Xanthomonadales bacterium]|nr:hypothetical protein [Xanthomonadales bacterium]
MREKSGRIRTEGFDKFISATSAIREKLLPYKGLMPVERLLKEQELANRRAEQSFLYESGAVDALKVVAGKLPGDWGDVKIGIAKPSADRPMDVVLRFNRHALFDELDWDSVVVGVASEGEKKRLMVSGVYMLPVGEEGLQDVVQEAVQAPLRRTHFAVHTRPEQVGPYKSEIKMKGRKRIKFSRSKKS